VEELADRLRTAAARGRDGTGRNQRVWDLPGLDPAFDRLAVHPDLLAAARRLLGPDLHLTEFCAHVVQPGAAAQYLHADQNPAPLPWTESTMLTVIWMLDRFGVDNGALEVVPGSHRVAAPPPYGGSLPDAIPVTGAPGTAVLLDGRTWHRAGANRTTVARLGVIVNYGRPYLARSPHLLSVGDGALDARFPGLIRR